MVNNNNMSNFSPVYRRTPSHLTVNTPGEGEVEFKILHVLPFDSGIQENMDKDAKIRQSINSYGWHIIDVGEGVKEENRG